MEGILANARAGDAGAQAQIYALLAPGVFALIRRLVGVRAVAEDVFQDTMIIVFEQLDQYRQEAPLGAWAGRIALSRCLMFLRSPWHPRPTELRLPQRSRGLAGSDSPVPPGSRCRSL